MDKEFLNHCPSCGSATHHEIFECTDHFISGEKFPVVNCAACGLLFTNPRPAHASISTYYDSDAYVSHSKTRSGMINALFHLSRTYTLARKRNLVRRYSSGRDLLDYGCGTGDFLKTMRSSGFSCSGIEPNEDARQKAMSPENISILDEDGLEHFNKSSFDVITLWHVLEHVYPLTTRLSQFNELLREDGRLFIAVPNHRSWDAKRYGPYWAAWDVPRHIYHFNRNSITDLMLRHGFTLVKTRPQLLDAFYISLLSEKYQSGRQNIFRACLNGLRSNFSARFMDGNYSSIIYIFKKS